MINFIHAGYLKRSQISPYGTIKQPQIKRLRVRNDTTTITTVRTRIGLSTYVQLGPQVLITGTKERTASTASVSLKVRGLAFSVSFPQSGRCLQKARVIRC